MLRALVSGSFCGAGSVSDVRLLCERRSGGDRLGHGWMRNTVEERLNAWLGQPGQRRGAAPPFPSTASQQWSQIVWTDIFRSQPNNGRKRWPPAGVIRRPLIKAYM